MPSTFLTLLSRLPEAQRLAMAAKAAYDGDAEAREYLKSDGWAQALDLWRPGAGEVGKRALGSVAEFVRQSQGDVIEGEYREVEATPGESFIRRMLAQPSGGHIILGPMGSGKTQTAIKIAHRVSQAHGYKVNWLGLYNEDVPDFGRVISFETLIKRMEQLKRYLAATEEEDEDDDFDDEEPDEEPKDDGKPPRLPPTRRVLVIDEVGLTLSSSAHDPARKASLRALAQCRHLDWVVVWIGQQAGQFPLGLLAQSTVWVKRPDGRESRLDRVDIPLVRDLWERAKAGHDTIRESKWFAGPWANPKAWAFVDCQSIGGKPGYSGMVPVSMYSASDQDEDSTDTENGEA